jgi:hypothetical protein
MRPELNAQRKIMALERRRALIDALIDFIRTHPESASEGRLVPLAHRTGLRYDFAVIRPLWKNGHVTLRLEKYLEEWYAIHPEDNLWMEVSPNRIVRQDVTAMSDEELCELLDNVHHELIPIDFEDA